MSTLNDLFSSTLSHRRSASFRISAFCLLVLATGCHSTYSPPVRTGSFGAPAGVVSREAELGLTAGVIFPEAPIGGHGGALLAIGTTDWLAIEAGGEFAYERSASGHGALRFTLDGPNGRLSRLDVDLALGGGAGVGGMVCDNKDYEDTAEGLGTLASEVTCPGEHDWDGLLWHERTFGGGLFELAFGFPNPSYLMVPFTRLRLQVTDGEGTPTTLWVSIGGGIHLNLAHNFRFHVGLAVEFYHNEIDPLGKNDESHVNALFDLGLAFGIPTDRREAREEEPDAGEPPQ